MVLETDVLIATFTALATGAGAYAAIRADLARLHERAAVALASAQRAHERIDALAAFDARAA